MLSTREDFDPRLFLDAELRELERTNFNTLCKVHSCEKLPFTIPPNQDSPSETQYLSLLVSLYSQLGMAVEFRASAPNLRKANHERRSCVRVALYKSSQTFF